MLKRLLFPFVVFLVSTAILWYSPTVSESFRPKAYSNQEFVRASVIDVLAESTQSDPLVPSVKTGRQRLLVELLEGEEAGKQVEVENQLSRLHNVYVAEGDRFILLVREQGSRTIYWPYNHDRSSAVYWMVGIIVLLTVLVCRFARRELGDFFVFHRCIADRSISASTLCWLESYSCHHWLDGGEDCGQLPVGRRLEQEVIWCPCWVHWLGW